MISSRSIGRDTRLIPAPIYFGGGLAGRFAKVLMDQYFGEVGWPANIAVAGFDTCVQNDLANMTHGPGSSFTRLQFSGLRHLSEMVTANPGWERDIDVALLKRTGSVVGEDGTLKGPHRTQGIIAGNTSELAVEADRVIRACDNPSNMNLTQNAMDLTYVAGCGGSGAGIALTLAIMNYLRRCSPEVSHGREHTQRLILAGASFFLGSDSRHASRCQGIQAAYFRALNTLLLEGTRTRDHRFGDGVFPGLESLASSVEEGVPEIPPGVLNEVVVLEQRSMGGGHLTLELLEEMLASEIYWRSQLPEITTRMRELLSELYDTTRAREARERTAYRFSSFGFRALELPPTLRQVRELVLGKKAGEAALAAPPAGTEIPAINFGRANISALGATWQTRITEEGVRIPTPEALATRIIEHEDDPTPLSVIEKELDRVRHLMPRRIDETIGDLGVELIAIESQFNEAVSTRRRLGALSVLDQELEALGKELEKELAVAPLPDDQPLEHELRQLSLGIEDAEVPDEEDAGFWSAVGFAIRSFFGSISKPKTQSVQPEVRDNARKAARLLCNRAAAVRDWELATRQAAIAQSVLDRLSALRRELAVQMADIREYVTSADQRSHELYDASRRQNAVRMTLVPAFDVLIKSVELASSMLRTTLERLADGRPVEEALGHATPLPVNFVQLYTQSPEAQQWLSRAWADVSPQAPINKAELKGVDLSLRTFIMFPPELEAEIRRKLNPDDSCILMPVEGIEAILIERWLPGLPARAFQTLRQCEDALEGLEPDDQDLCFLWGRYRQAPSLLIANRVDSDREVAAALLLHPDIQAGDALSLKIDGMQIAGQSDMHPEPAIFQDGKGIWHVAVNITGHGRFVRSLRTEDFRVALDIICANADYRQAVREWLQNVATNCKFGADDALRGALEQVSTWLNRTYHEIEETPFEDLPDDDTLRAERIVVEQARPVVDRLFELATDFRRGGRWVQRFQHQGRILQMPQRARA